MILDGGQVGRVVDERLPGFGGEDYRCDAIFVRKPLTTARVMAVAETREGIDEIWKGPPGSSTTHASPSALPVVASRRSWRPPSTRT